MVNNKVNVFVYCYLEKVTIMCEIIGKVLTEHVIEHILARKHLHQMIYTCRRFKRTQTQTKLS